MSAPADIVKVDVDASMEHLMGEIQLPPGVGELIPNLLFVGPHEACEEMVRRLGVRYIVDVFEDKEAVATTLDNGYEAKTPALEEELRDLKLRLKALVAEERRRLAGSDEENESEEEKGEEDKEETGEEQKEEDVATDGDTKDFVDNSHALVVKTGEDVSDTDDVEFAVSESKIPSAKAELITAVTSPNPAASRAPLSDVQKALEAKQRYLQLVADIKHLKSEAERIEKRRAEYDALFAPKDDATAASTDTPAKEKPATHDDDDEAHTQKKKKPSDYVRYNDCNVVSPITATAGYDVVYPREVRLLHLHMQDALIEDLAKILNMGTPTQSHSEMKEKKKSEDTPIAQGDDECRDPADERGPNGFVTMEEMLAEFPPPTFSPPYALVELLDAIVGQNPSEADLRRLSVAAAHHHQNGDATNNQSSSSSAGYDRHVAAFDQRPAITRHAIYIHCFAGKSRSASVALAFAMMSELLGHRQLDELMEVLAFTAPLTVKRTKGYLVRKGQGCRPNPRFMRDLIALEAGVQTELQTRSGLPPSRCRPFETAFDLDTFNVEGLVDLFSNAANPNARIPVDVVIDTYEQVCHGDVLKARRLLLAEQTRLLVSPKVRQEMYIDNVMRVLAQDVDYYLLERQKIVGGAYDSTPVKSTETPEERRKRLEAKLKAFKVATPRELVGEVLSSCQYNEEKALAILREMREKQAATYMKRN